MGETPSEELKVPSEMSDDLKPREKQTTDTPESEDFELAKKRDEGRRRGEIGDYFDYSEDGAKRVERLFERMEPFLRSGAVDRQDLKNRLIKLESVQDRKEFISKALAILKPIYELGMRNEEGERIEKVKINRVFGYNVKEGTDTIEIHLATTGIELSRVEELFMEGLIKLAERIREDPSMTHINRIHADSRLIKKHPERVEQLGFTIVKGETIHSMGAIISKGDFINKFGKR